MTKNIEKIEWLREWTERNKMYFDVLNEKLVDDFSDRFSPKVNVQPFGANICRSLGKLLSWGYKNGYLERGRVSICNAEKGFPNWVYVYNFKQRRASA